MKNRLIVKHEIKTILMDRTFAKKSEDTRSEEYQQLQSVRKDYPTYKVARKQIKKAPGKESYKNLTYDYMRDYISFAETEENMEIVLAELEQKILISHCHSQAYRYPVIKRWFLEKYPEVKEHGVISLPETEDKNIFVA